MTQKERDQEADRDRASRDMCGRPLTETEIQRIRDDMREMDIWYPEENE